MGRRISLHRHKAKVRGISRRLRALENWATEFSDLEPYCSGKYVNYKIPVLDRMVRPPTATDEIYSRVTSAVVAGAEHLSVSEFSKKHSYFRVAALICLPDMFSSEVCVFYDEEYYLRFWHDNDCLPLDSAPSQKYGVSVPDGFSERGKLIVHEEDWGEEGIKSVELEHWTIGQRP